MLTISLISNDFTSGSNFAPALCDAQCSATSYGITTVQVLIKNSGFRREIPAFGRSSLCPMRQTRAVALENELTYEIFFSQLRRIDRANG